MKDSLIAQKHRGNKYFTIGWAEEDWSMDELSNRRDLLMAIESLIWPWNKSIMHVQFMDTLHRRKRPFTVYRLLTAHQYLQLISFIKKGFVLKSNKPVVRSYRGYYGYDYFFSSTRKYNAFNTCNQWTADALNSCNIRNPIFAPFVWSIAYQLKR